MGRPRGRGVVHAAQTHVRPKSGRTWTARTRWRVWKQRYSGTTVGVAFIVLHVPSAVYSIYAFLTGIPQGAPRQDTIDRQATSATFSQKSDLHSVMRVMGNPASIRQSDRPTTAPPLLSAGSRDGVADDEARVATLPPTPSRALLITGSLSSDIMVTDAFPSGTPPPTLFCRSQHCNKARELANSPNAFVLHANDNATAVGWRPPTSAQHSKATALFDQT